MTVGNVYDIIDSIAPFSEQMEFDNAGLLIGSRENEARKILVCLDVSLKVALEAKEKGCDLIVSHHPLIFSPLYNIESDSIPVFLIKNNISLISAHTNIDLSERGTNAYLFELLGLKNLKREGLLFKGELEKEVSAEEFLGLVKTKIKTEKMRYVNPKSVKTVAICSGSGGDLLKEAADCDCFITGDVKHNVFIEAKNKGQMLLDAGHFETEWVFVKRFAEIIREKTKAEVISSEKEERPFEIY